MNGRDDDYDYDPPDDYRDDGPPPDTRSGVDCPYCGGEMEEWSGFYCGQCDAEWDSAKDVAREYVALDLIYEQMTGGRD